MNPLSRDSVIGAEGVLLTSNRSDGLRPGVGGGRRVGPFLPEGTAHSRGHGKGIKKYNFYLKTNSVAPPIYSLPVLDVKLI